MSVAGAEMRRVAGAFATGVTVVTAAHGVVPCGLTVNSFASVSLEPPLVLVCISRRARAHSGIEAAGGFAVNVLAEGQEGVARLFASLAEDKFTGLDHRPSPAGHPLLAGTCAWLDCEVVASHAAGTHTIHVGRVTALDTTARPPLLFHRGRYTLLAE
ncbi:MAG: flavin reductase family protein [Chloroflexi bacterium]|nr:flavin reductase family protein [Chloroflexota bacterium]